MRPNTVTLNSLSLARVSTASFLLAMLIATAAMAVEDNPARTRPKAEQPQTAQRVIVKFRQASRLSAQATTSGESATADAAAAETARMSALASRARITVQASRALGANMHVMQIAPDISNETAAETLARLRADSEVEFAELDRRVYPHATSNDPLATGQWYLQAIEPSAINANGAWETTKGSNGVVVAVIDTGVLFDHPDINRANSGGRFLPGYDFVSPDPDGTFLTSNDGNGRDSDASDPGDWVAPEDDCGTSSDSSWHGTRVSGIIGALTNNSSGIAGINWNGFILPVRVLGKCGGFNSDVIAGMRWAAGLNVPGVPNNPNPAKVLNISLGGEGACDAASQTAISEVVATGALVVVSAGNEGGPVDSPANCSGAMGIVGLRHKGTKVGFSSLGPQISLGAPGGNCVNITGGPCLFSIDTTNNAGATTPGTHTFTNQTDFNVGTSFSAPIVSGIAGLMLAVNGNLKGPQLIKRMQDGSSKPFPTTSDTAGTLPVCHVPVGPGDVQATECICTTSTCGAGMANANGAVNEALRPIAAISAPASVSGGQNVTLNGGGSAAACNHTISSYAWTVVSGTAAPSPTNTATTTVTAPSTGSATIRLTVTDEAGKTDFADITVNSTSTSTTAPASAGTSACLGAASVTPAVTVTASDANAAEGTLDPGMFTITRSGGTAAALTVNVAITGNATSAGDYTALATSVNIPAGQTTATLTVTPVEDTTVEGAESVTLTVQAAGTYDVGSPSSATVTIADNDTSAAPPPANSDGGGGGGALDWLTLLAAIGFTGRAVLRRRVAR